MLDAAHDQLTAVVVEHDEPDAGGGIGPSWPIGGAGATRPDVEHGRRRDAGWSGPPDGPSVQSPAMAVRPPELPSSPPSCCGTSPCGSSGASSSARRSAGSGRSSTRWPASPSTRSSSVCSSSVTPPVGDPSGLDVYGFFLVCGLLPWTFLTNGLNGARRLDRRQRGPGQEGLLPAWVLPAASTLAWLASFGVELVVLGVVLLAVGNMVLPWIPVVSSLMVLQTGFVLGLGLLLGAANAYFRDVQHFLAIVLNVWFYATPILYPPELIPEETELLGVDDPASAASCDVNPMADFVDAYRDLLYDLRCPRRRPVLAMSAWPSAPWSSAPRLPPARAAPGRGAVMADPAIEVDDVAKRFRLVHERNSTLKATVFSGFRRTVHEDFWALDDVSLRGPGGHDLRPHRPQRLGQEHAAQVHGPHLPPRPRLHRDRGRMSALLELGAGFHPELSGRENVYLNGSILGLSEQRGRPALRRDRRVRRARAVHRHPGEELLVGHVRAARVRGGHQRRARRAARRRGARRRRRELPAAVPREVRRPPPRGRTIVLVSHGLDTVRNLCDRRRGSTTAACCKEGEAHDVVTAYLESVRDDRRAREHESAASCPPEEATAAGTSRRSSSSTTPGVTSTWSGQRLDCTSGSRSTPRQTRTVALAIGLYRTDGVHVAGPVHRLPHRRVGAPQSSTACARFDLATGTYDVSTRLLGRHLEPHPRRSAAVRPGST